MPDKVPVTLLCGFLGSGKTTLLKHILETKHEDEDFKAAVIVNDMAELNIDKSLIDQTSLIQSEEDMVGMQNGCICCTLQDDLVEQMISLIQKKKFNYILIEASGLECLNLMTLLLCLKLMTMNMMKMTLTMTMITTNLN